MSDHIFVTGDCHGENNIQKLSSRKWPEGKKLDREDYLIVAGDFRLLWSNNPKDKLEQHLKRWYSQEKPWTTLVVDGNHENHKRLNALPTKEMFGGTVGVIHENIYHLRRGEVYIINGSKFFVMGGATSVDKIYRRIDISWWEEEIPNHSQFDHGLDNLEKNNWQVDYVVTHTIPFDASFAFNFGMGDYKGLTTCSVSRYLNHVALNLKYKEWYFGHFHDDINKGKFHLVYNNIIQIQ